MFDLTFLSTELDLLCFLGAILPLLSFLIWYLLEAAWHLVQHLEHRHIKSKIKTKFNISDFNPKPCPFCGSDHIKIENRHFLKFEEFSIKCAGCGMATEFGCAGHIIGLWNNRSNENED